MREGRCKIHFVSQEEEPKKRPATDEQGINVGKKKMKYKRCGKESMKRGKDRGRTSGREKRRRAKTSNNSTERLEVGTDAVMRKRVREGGVEKDR